MAKQCSCSNTYTYTGTLSDGKPVCIVCGEEWPDDEAQSEVEDSGVPTMKDSLEAAVIAEHEKKVKLANQEAVAKLAKLGIRSKSNELRHRVENLLVYIGVELSAPNDSGGEGLENAYLYDEGYNDCLNDIKGKLEHCLKG